MPTIEITSRVTRRSLMNRSKDELATRVLELMDEAVRVRQALEQTRLKLDAARQTLAEIGDGQGYASCECIDMARDALAASDPCTVLPLETQAASLEISGLIEQVAAAAVSPPARASSLPAVGSFG